MISVVAATNNTLARKLWASGRSHQVDPDRISVISAPARCCGQSVLVVAACVSVSALSLL
jgi:hypothetical protein